MIRLVTVLCVAGIASGVSIDHVGINDTVLMRIGFLKFATLHGRTYFSSEELQMRYETFSRNNDIINSHNAEFARGLHSYTMGINQFADMTLQEYHQTMLGFKPDLERSSDTGVALLSTLSVNLPDSVDWRAKEYVTEVGNQGQCGSCWAFTATGALEGQHKKKTGVLVDLSEQNLMDCSQNQGNQGCEGGFMDDAFKYVKENGGIDTEQSYPYNVTNPGSWTCKYQKANIGATCTGFVDLPKANETALQQAVAMIGPIATAVDASHQGFQFYKSGVYDDSKCNPAIVDHSLIVTGYGVENGKEYYECKNSWGTSWGNEGYIRMVRNKDNQCGIASIASYPTV